MTIATNSSDSPGAPEEFVVYHSQGKVAGFAALYLVMLPLMPYMFFFKALPRHDGRVIGAAFITFCGFLFFGYIFLTAARVLRSLRSPQPRPALVINDRGFRDQSSVFGGKGWVSWEEVESVSIEPSGRFLCITLEDEEAYYRKRQPQMGRLNTWLRRISPKGAPLALMGTFLPLSLPDILAQMQRYQAQYLDNQNSQREPK